MSPSSFKKVREFLLQKEGFDPSKAVQLSDESCIERKDLGGINEKEKYASGTHLLSKVAKEDSSERSPMFLPNEDSPPKILPR
jgi:hypothetical protein